MGGGLPVGQLKSFVREGAMPAQPSDWVVGMLPSDKTTFSNFYVSLTGRLQTANFCWIPGNMATMACYCMCTYIQVGQLYIPTGGEGGWVDLLAIV